MAALISYVTDGDGYQAGVCNIGPAEIRRRRRSGYVGVAAAIVIAVTLVVIDAPSISRLLVAVPLAAGLSGLIQAQLRFCANYGWRGIRNLGAIGDAQRVDDTASRAEDRRRSLQILSASALGGLSVAILFALLPL
jgi:hypothetical protein